MVAVSSRSWPLRFSFSFAALPGAMIFMVSISFNLLSDGLRSAMDVQR